MKDFLSKEHYCYKIHAPLIESSALSFYRQPPSMAFPTFVKENLVPLPFYNFSKISLPPFF